MPQSRGFAAFFGQSTLGTSAPAGGYLDVDAAFAKGGSFSSTPGTKDRASSLRSDSSASFTPRSQGGGSSSLYSNPMRRSASPTSSPYNNNGAGRRSEMLPSNVAPELTAARRSQLVEFIDRSVDDAYNLCYGFGRLRWEHSRTKDGVTICGAVSKDGETHLDATVRSKCAITASFDEVMDLLITESSEDFVEFELSVNPQEFLDGQVLYVLVPRMPNDRFVCVKWHCIKSLAPSVAKHRDYVYVEVVDHFVDQEGKKVGVRLCRSVELEELARFDTTSMFVRGKTMMLQTFTAAAAGHLEVHSMVLNEPGGRLPTWLLQKIMDNAAMRPGRLREYIDRKRMEMLVLTRPHQVVPLSARGCCGICTRAFSLVRKKYNCVACGDVMCSQCSVRQVVSLSVLDELVKRHKARMCVKCSSAAKTKELPRRQQRDDPHFRRNAATTLAPRRAISQTQLRASDSKTYALREKGRSASSSFETWKNSDSSIEDAAQGERSTIDGGAPPPGANLPQMFQFRPTSGGDTKRSSESHSYRSSSAMTASSSPGDSTGAGDESVLTRSSGSASSRGGPKVDLGIGKYRASCVNGDADDNVGDDDEDGMTSPSTGSPSSSPIPDPAPMASQELEIADMRPSGQVTSLNVDLETEDSEVVQVVKPVVIRPMKRKSFGRKSSMSRPSLSKSGVVIENGVEVASFLGEPEHRSPAPPPPTFTIENGVETASFLDEPEQRLPPPPLPPGVSIENGVETASFLDEPEPRMPPPPLPPGVSIENGVETASFLDDDEPEKRLAPPPVPGHDRMPAPPPPLPERRRLAPEPPVLEQQRKPAPSPPGSESQPRKPTAPPPPPPPVADAHTRTPAPEPPSIEPQQRGPAPPLPQPRRAAAPPPPSMETELRASIVEEVIIEPAELHHSPTSKPQTRAPAPPPPPPSKSATSSPVRKPAPMPERDSILESSEAAALLLEEAIGDNAEQLAEFQTQLNRMTIISKETQHGDHLADPTIMEQAISETEKKALAEAAIVASLIDAGTSSVQRASMNSRASLNSRASFMSRPSLIDSRPSMLTRPSFSSQRSSFMQRPSMGTNESSWRRDPPVQAPLGREDGGFTAYLADSTFTDIDTAPGEVELASGWKAVVPKSTGRVYYYNASCGRTSWTPPLAETARNDSDYIVL